MAELCPRFRPWKAANRIREKGTSASALDHPTPAQPRKVGIRCPIEHVFGFMENTMNGPEPAYIGIERIEAGIGLGNLTDNLCRFVQPLRPGRVPKMT